MTPSLNPHYILPSLTLTYLFLCLLILDRALCSDPTYSQSVSRMGLENNQLSCSLTGDDFKKTSETPNDIKISANDAKYFKIFIQNSMVAGIHITLTRLETLIILDRTDSNNTRIKLPNSNNYAFAVEVDLKTRSIRALDILTNVFCSAGQDLPNGTLISIGGSTSFNSRGAYSFRSFTPCASKRCGFSIVGEMQSRRWYPSSQILPDGRIFILGGANVTGNIPINRASTDNPTYEFWPRKNGEKEKYMKFLSDTLPFNLYPFVHLLRSGYLFIFSGRKSIMFDYINNRVVKTFPELGSPNIVRQYPVAGVSFLLPLSKTNDYRPEIVVCGGSSKSAYLNPNVVASAECGRIAPEDSNPKWEIDYMPFPRVMGSAILLVDGTVLVLNGARRGYGRLRKDAAGDPVLTPVLYQPKNPLGKRWSIVPASSAIPRMYHASAILLPDTTVLISGSNPNERSTTLQPFPTEYRIEKFYPHYLQTGKPRPKITKGESPVGYAKKFTMQGNAPRLERTAYSACLINSGFSTHSQIFGQRLVTLYINNFTQSSNGDFKARFTMPGIKEVLPPGYYWFHFLADGIPNQKGWPIRVQ